MRTFVSLLLLFTVFAAFGSVPQPEYVPLCDSPLALGPLIPGGAVSARSVAPVIWNGRDFAVFFNDGGSLYFRRFYADGTPADARTFITSTDLSESVVSAVYNGNGYGIAYEVQSAVYRQIYFVRTDRYGNVLSGPTKVSMTGGIPESGPCLYPSVAWSGSGYCVVFSDGTSNTTHYAILATQLDSDGAIAGTGNYHDTLVGGGAGTTQKHPCVAYSVGNGKYQVVWDDDDGVLRAIVGNQLSLLNVADTTTFLVFGSTVAETCSEPKITSNGTGFGMVWRQYNAADSNIEIYFQKLTSYGYPLGSPVRITYSPATSFDPMIVWTGGEYGVFWGEWSAGTGDLWFQRVSSIGTMTGQNVQVTVTGEMEYPSAAFAAHGYLLTGSIYQRSNFVLPWGCTDDTTLPTCPGNLIAYGITGTQATIAWSPAGGGSHDIACYVLYRNNSELVRTSNTSYIDNGLSLNTTYNYMVQPVNALSGQNYSCTTSIYTKTNATLILKMDKSDPNARLYWNDEGMNNYNVFRGTSPQVMSLIGNTSSLSHDDPNVLLDHVNYFYTVDDPGQ